MILMQVQIALLVEFLEHKNSDQSPMYVKDKIRYELETSYYLTNSENNSVSYGLHTVGFQDPSQISYQETELQYTEVVGKEFLIDPYFDQNDNSWYLIEVNLTAHETVIIRQRFEITRLNIIVNNLEEYESSSYRAQKYDKYRDMYLAQETEREVLSPELIVLSKKIVDSEDSPLIKAERIYEWIGDNIEYDKAYKGGGALNTYLEGKGTCGDYTDLMITLLRIQKIPARKVHGFFLDDRWPQKGDEYEIRNGPFSHAWAEYFIPEVGWVICEPTFGISHNNYYAAIDCSHFRTFTGEFNFSQNYVKYKFVESNHEVEEQTIEYHLYCHEVDSVYSIKVVETENTNSLYEQMSIFFTIFTLTLALNGAVFIVSVILDMRKTFLQIRSELFSSKLCEMIDKIKQNKIKANNSCFNFI